jgi:hypothetical protein
MKIFIYQAKGGSNLVQTWTRPWFGPCPIHEWSSSGSALEEFMFRFDKKLPELDLNRTPATLGIIGCLILAICVQT